MRVTSSSVRSGPGSSPPSRAPVGRSASNTSADAAAADVVRLRARLAAPGCDLPLRLRDGRTLGPADRGYRLVLTQPWSLRALLAPMEHRGYAWTLRRWVANLRVHHGEAVALVGEATTRIWRAYMAGAVVGFETQDHGVVQILAARGQARLPFGRERMQLASASGTFARSR